MSNESIQELKDMVTAGRERMEELKQDISDSQDALRELRDIHQAAWAELQQALRNADAEPSEKVKEMLDKLKSVRR